MDERNYGESEESKIAELQGIMDQVSKDLGVIEAYNLKFPYLKDLKEKYPDIGDYKLYHMLIGSSNYKTDSEMQFDLPGGEIEAFIREFPEIAERAKNKPA